MKITGVIVTVAVGFFQLWGISPTQAEWVKEKIDYEAETITDSGGSLVRGTLRLEYASDSYWYSSYNPGGVSLTIEGKGREHWKWTGAPIFIERLVADITQDINGVASYSGQATAFGVSQAGGLFNSTQMSPGNSYADHNVVPSSMDYFSSMPTNGGVVIRVDLFARSAAHQSSWGESSGHGYGRGWVIMSNLRSVATGEVTD